MFIRPNKSEIGVFESNKRIDTRRNVELPQISIHFAARGNRKFFQWNNFFFLV